MPSTFSTPYREELAKYEQGPRAKQKEFMERFQFEEVSIKDSKDIQAGDHLISRKGLYDHHMLCSDKCTDQLKIIEYSGPVTGNISADVLSSVASKGLFAFGKVVERSYPVTEFLKKKILKIKWPPELERFSVTEVIERARSRVNETWYDLLKNNCEHFVTWCKCGLSVSRQVSNGCLLIGEVVYSFIAGFYDCVKKKAALPLLIKIAANATDEVAGFICAHSELVGFGLGFLLEAGWAFWEIYKAFNYSKTSREFWTKFVDVVAKAVCRLGGGFLGSWLGAMMGGLVGSLACGALGAGLGHFVGAFIAWCYENSEYIDG